VFERYLMKLKATSHRHDSLHKKVTTTGTSLYHNTSKNTETSHAHRSQWAYVYNRRKTPSWDYAEEGRLKPHNDQQDTE
jgi:hypothetical protein